MRAYLDLGKEVLEKGRWESTRTGIRTKSLFGKMFSHDMRTGFPIITTRRTGIYDVGKELFMFLGGITDNNWLNKHGCHIWDEWALSEDITKTIVFTSKERLGMLGLKLKELGLVPSGELTEIDKLMGYSWSLATNKDINNAITWLQEQVIEARKDNPGLSDYDFEQSCYKKYDIPATREKVLFKKGELGPIYGSMWRAWPTTNGGYIDQIKAIDEKLKLASNSRRLICSAWNVEYLPDESKPHDENIANGKQVLSACHSLFQVRLFSMTIDEIIKENQIEDYFVSDVRNLLEDRIYETEEEYRKEFIQLLEAITRRPKLKITYMSLLMFARSQDCPLGTPYNISSYALLLALWANTHNMVPLELHIAMGDVHVYENQIELFSEQVQREPQPLPKLVINPDLPHLLDIDIDKMDIKDIYHLEGYEPLPAIRYPRPAV